MTHGKRVYETPTLTKYTSLDKLPERVRNALLAQEFAAEKPTAVFDHDRRYVSVSESFARLMGYPVHELIGKRVDDITSSNTVDIEFIFRALLQLGEMDGLWMFNHRNGKKVLVHYHAKRASESYTGTVMEPLLIAG